MASANQYCVMKWTNDGDRLSTLHMRHIIEPKKKFDNYMVGDHGLAVYPGYAGQWTFLILAIGETKEQMDTWLENFMTASPKLKRAKKYTKKSTGATPGKTAISAAAPTAVAQAPLPTLVPAPTAVVQAPLPTLVPAPTAVVQAPTAPLPTLVPAPTAVVQAPKETPPPTAVVQAPTAPLPTLVPAPTAVVQAPKETPPPTAAPSTEAPAPTVKPSSSSHSSYRKLEKKISSLEKRVKDLENAREMAQAVVHIPTESEEKKMNLTTLLECVGHLTASSERDVCLIILLECVGHLTASSERDVCLIIKRLSYKVFSSNELINGTRTGKKTVKAGEKPKPALETERMDLLEKAVLTKCPDLTTTAFYKKFDNILKVAVREAKPVSP